MDKLNKAQSEQVKDLGEAVSEEYAQLMLKYTRIVSSEELDNLYNETMELMELEESSEDYVYSVFDMCYYSVASNYCTLDNDTIEQAFGFYGDYNLYMDDNGRGLVVGYY